MGYSRSQKRSNPYGCHLSQSQFPYSLKLRKQEISYVKSTKRSEQLTRSSVIKMCRVSYVILKENPSFPSKKARVEKNQ